MSKFERYNGEFHNMEPTLVNRTTAERIDDYQMKIYEVMKLTHPNAVGYTATCHECKDENGELDIHTKFFIDRGNTVKAPKMAEKLAEYAIKSGNDNSTSVVEGFAEQLLDGFIEGNGVEMDDTEVEAMNADLIDFIEDMLVPEADQLIAEWNRDAQEAYEEREEARRGQY